MNYKKAKKLTGHHFDSNFFRNLMNTNGAFSDRHEAETAGFRQCAHRKSRPGYNYTAVRTSTKGHYAYYSLWARKDQDQ